MCLNYFLGEETLYLQSDEQVAFENRKNSDPAAVIEEIIQDRHRLECIVSKRLSKLLSFIRFPLNHVSFFVFGPSKCAPAQRPHEGDGKVAGYLWWRS